MNPRWLGRLLLGSAFVVMVTMTGRSDGDREREFVQTNLVSDIPGLAAITDPLEGSFFQFDAPGSSQTAAFGVMVHSSMV